MTKPLDPDIKALRAIVRALEPLDEQARMRILEWSVARYVAKGGIFRDPRR
jgi:hypothetical protein